MQLVLNYDLLRGWKAVVLTTLFFELILQGFIYLHPENIGWMSSPDFSITNLLRFVFIDQFLIECITVAIIFALIRFYALHLQLFQVRLNARDLLLYELKFLPILLLSFFFFAPFTLTVRYLFHHFPELNSELYFQEYFYSTSLYLNYLIPVLLIGYTIINVNLVKLYNQQLSYTTQDLNKLSRDLDQVKRRQASPKSRLTVFDDFGELLLEVSKIKWIEREDRKTFATTNSTERYRIKATISELEKKLDPDKFVQINRSVIINLNELLNYSFWENDKYIVRMKDSDKEFVMSRMRLKKIKDKLL